MKSKQLFIDALHTLLFSWGGDTPSEAIWAANDLLDWYEEEYSVAIGVRLKENLSNHEEVLTTLENI